MKSINLSHDLKLPVDVATEALAWIGARGSGKTHGVGKLAEEFFLAGVPFVWLDPVGVAYGLRLAKDGKGPGLSVPVFGGLHGDVPLEPTAGALLADLIADKNFSAVLDVSQFDTDAMKARFVSDFAERLFSRKKKDPSVLHWIVDEAQEFVPQNPQRGEEMMLHRMQRVLKLGRNFGIGVSLLTQRPQETSKKALNQCQTVLAFRLTGPQERKAMKEWIAAHDLDQRLTEKLPSLETGTCHVWSPAFLKVSQEVRILPKNTFDASATPKFGERRAARELPPIDLEKIKAEMAVAVEKARADDPRELKRQIAELRALVGKQPAVAVKQEVVTKTVEKKVVPEQQMTRLEAALKRLEKVAEATAHDHEVAAAAVAEMRGLLRAASGLNAVTPILPRHPAIQQRGTPLSKTYVIPLAVELPRPRQRILDALAWLESIGVSAGNRTMVAFRADQSPTSSGYTNNLSALKSAGYIVYPDSSTARLTDEGRLLASIPERPASNEELHRAVLAKLPAPRRRIMEVVLKHYPQSVPREELAHASGQSPTSSGYTNNLSALKSLGVLTYPNSREARAADTMFLEAVTA